MTRRKQVTVVVAPQQQQIQQRKKNKNKNGGNVTRLGTALRYLGAMGGGAAGGALGYQNAGAALGTGLGAAVSKWLGSGDYRVSGNSILRGSSSVPMMHKTDQTITVRHREFVTTISGSTEFRIQGSFPLNPGLRGTMPWASGIAAQFQEYKIKGLVWHYVPTSGTFTGGTVALGAVMMQTVYRATDSNPTSKYELLNEYWSNESLPCDSMIHPIECAPSETVLPRRYIRTGTVSDDLMFYDYGRSIIATQGMPNTALVGDLYITYEIEFSKPKLATALGDTISSAVFTGSGTSQQRWLTTQTVVSTYSGNITLATTDSSAYTRLTIPPGNPGTHVVLMESGSSSTPYTSYTPSLTGVNAVFINNFIEASLNIPTSAITNSRQMYNFAFRVVDSTQPTTVTLDMSGANNVAQGTVGLCVVSQLDPEITNI